MTEPRREPLPAAARKPDWLKAPPAGGAAYHGLKRLLRASGLRTVCESAACPNRGECFASGTATFLLLGGACTRACTFCNIGPGPVAAPDPDEPARVAGVVRELALRLAVVTSVTRDDLPDGGAAHFAATIRAIGARSPACRVEVLIPDLGGDPRALQIVLQAAPDVLNHNLETVPRLYPEVRPQARYGRSLLLLRRAAQWGAAAARRPLIKTGLMVGLGETRQEVLAVMREAAAAGAEVLTIGQYLRPTPAHHPVERYWRPEEFADLAVAGQALGLARVEAGPLVRSSYHAGGHFENGSR